MRNAAMSVLALALAAAPGCWWIGQDEDDGADAGPGTSLAGSEDLGVAELDEPRDVHTTWRRSTSTTLTFSWRTLRRLGYTPRLWLAPADACDADGGAAT